MSDAGDAKRLLSDPILKQAFTFAREAMLNAAMNCTPGDPLAFRYLDAARSIDNTKAYLSAIISAGDLEEAQAQAAKVADFYEERAKQRYRSSNGQNVDAQISAVVNGS